MRIIRPVSLIGYLVLAYDAVRWLLEWPLVRRLLELANMGQAIDFILDHWQHPGWMGNPWVQFLAILLGVALIVLDRRHPNWAFKASSRQMIIGGLAIIVFGVAVVAIGLWQSSAVPIDATIPGASNSPSPQSPLNPASAPAVAIPSKRAYLRVDAEALTAALRQMRDVLNESVRNASLAEFFSGYDNRHRDNPTGPLKQEAETIQEQLKKAQDFNLTVAGDLSKIMYKAGSSYQEDLMPFVQATNTTQAQAETINDYFRYLKLVAKLNDADAGDARTLMSDYNRRIGQIITDQYKARVADMRQVDAKIREIQDAPRQ
jgi:hypothetical protein